VQWKLKSLTFLKILNLECLKSVLEAILSSDLLGKYYRVTPGHSLNPKIINILKMYVIIALEIKIFDFFLKIIS